MFEKLRSKTVQKVEQGISVSFPIGFPAMIGGSRVLEYLYCEEVNEYAKKRLSTPIIKEPSDIHWFGELKVRFLARATAYVITVCSLDGILVRSYCHFLDCLKNIGYGPLIPNDGGSSIMSKRKTEISGYSFYRNKVFAHTSFAAPRKDSASLQHSSLLYYSGILSSIRGGYLSLGGGSVIVGGREEDIPEVSIVGKYPEIVDHYAAWEAMFTDILNKIPSEELSHKLETVCLL